MMKDKTKIILFFSLLPLILSAQLLEDFSDQKLPASFDFPLGIIFDETGRGFVWEKAGRVYIVDTLDKKSAEPLIDISEEVTNWKDHGLMSFALDRDFLQNGRIYLYYALDLHHYYHYGTPAYHPDSTTEWQATIGRVTRFEADPATDFTSIIPGSRKILLGETLDNGIPLTWQFHGLGDIVAANDGSLLLSCGDGTSSKGPDIGGDSLGTYYSDAFAKGILTEDQNLGSYRAQYVGSYNGKILRIDPETGDGLPSNPFYDASRPRSPASRVWSIGLRNPYRIMVKPETGSHYAADGNPGEILIGDVGTGSWEELNVATTGGQNFGWPIMEGPYWMGSFANVEAPQNPLARNPLFGGNSNCKREFFTFRELMEWPRSPGEELPPTNPCDFSQLIPLSDQLTIAEVPAVSWSNSRWNPPIRAVVPGFSENHNLTGISLSDPAAGVDGEEFGGFSSLAGIFYTGSSFPMKYRDKYFGFDHEGWIKVFDFDEEFRLKSVEDFHENALNIIHLALNPRNGSLYLVNMQSEVRKITYGGTPLPVAVIEADRFYGPGDLEVQFDGTSSYSPASTIFSHEWDFGDGHASTLPQPTHVFTADGTSPQSYRVVLTVTDSSGGRSTTEQIVSLNNTPPRARITSFEDGDLYPLDKTVVLELIGEVSDREHKVEDLTHRWQVFLHHNEHFHPEPVDFSPRAFTLISPLGCDRDEYWYRITFTVTDPEGLESSDNKTVFPACEDGDLKAVAIEAESHKELIELKWVDQVNPDIVSYEIQRTTDFFHFETVGKLIPAAEHSFVFRDSFPIRGTNIYRVKLINSERAFTYSNLTTAEFPLVEGVRLFPNPATDQIQLAIGKALENKVNLELYAPTGQKVLEAELKSLAGKPFRGSVPLDDLGNGMYYYRVVNGEIQAAGTLMIAK